jgi:predicted acylesterase/phospholipase RssA
MPPLTQPETVEKLPPDQGAIALCFSGGGLRATLFHLGLIRALRQSTLNKEMALKSVREVYAVSGGSILAAHFLANYPRYLGDDAEFEKVEKELLTFAARDLRNRVLRRWLFWMRVRNPRGQLLQREYHRFLEGKTVGECYAASADLPTFHFLSTSFSTGALCSFSRRCFEQVDRDSGNQTHTTAADGIPLAFAVAASSAFPPMFPPMLLTPEMLGTGGTPPFNWPIALSDGGVFDNFGIDKYCLAQRTSARPGILIVSNAGGSFATDPDHSYNGMLPRNIRASDILMRRVGETTLETGRVLAGGGLLLVRIGATVPDPDIAETTQQRFRLVRTDLDRFDGESARLIVEHGERVGRQALTDHKLAKNAPPTFSVGPSPRPAPANGATAPSAERTAELDQVLSGAALRTWRGFFFGGNDVALRALWQAIVVFAIGLFLFLIYSAFSFVTAQRAQLAEQEAKIAAQEALLAEKDSGEEMLERVRQATATGELNEIRRALAIAIETSEDRDAGQESSASKVAAPVSAAEVAEIIDTPVVRPLPKTQHRQKVFIHFAGELTRAQITALNQRLRQAGWNVQSSSGERIGSAAGAGDVRYAGDNGAAAKELADALNQSGLPIREVTPLSNPKIGGNLEVWISSLRQPRERQDPRLAPELLSPLS